MDVYLLSYNRKVRAVLRAKAEQGERLGTRAPYGYRYSEEDRNRLVVDEEAAAIVRHIFAMCAAGSGPSQIARKLKEGQILCPTTYAYLGFGIGHTSLNMEKPYHWTSSTVANMLENELYLGNTINMKYSTKSCKDKRHVEHPKEECLVFEGTHPALVTQEVWDIVQRVRQNRRRSTKMNKQNKYSGLVVCADFGTTMVLHRARTMKTTWNNFTCRTCKKERGTAHYIRECVLDEDRVLGYLSVEQFQTLSGGYTEEQSRLAKDIPVKETAIQKIVVHKKSVKWSKKAMQTIEIHYSDIGRIGGEVPQDKETPGRKLQRNSCRGTSPNRRYPYQGDANTPVVFSVFIRIWSLTPGSF